MSCFSEGRFCGVEPGVVALGMRYWSLKCRLAIPIYVPDRVRRKLLRANQIKSSMICDGVKFDSL